MSLTVKERGQWIATNRFVMVRLMETLARWVPTTPEMEVKLLFGTHLWDAAQHADILGKRTSELRLPLQHSVPPAPAYLDFLGEVDALTDTAQRISAYYDVMMPALARRSREYMDRTDRLLDAPTIRIFERITFDLERILRECAELRAQLPGMKTPDRASTERLVQREASLEMVSEIPPGDVKEAS